MFVNERENRCYISRKKISRKQNKGTMIIKNSYVNGKSVTKPRCNIHIIRVILRAINEKWEGSASLKTQIGKISLAITIKIEGRKRFKQAKDSIEG